MVYWVYWVSYFTTAILPHNGDEALCVIDTHLMGPGRWPAVDGPPRPMANHAGRRTKNVRRHAHRMFSHVQQWLAGSPR